ncbi:hypothetical protein [Nocardiopsis oceani]
MDTRPEPHSATAAQAALWYAEQAFYLYGRADRRGELHGERDTTRQHLIAQARSQVETACILYTLTENRSDQAVAAVLSVAAANESTAREHAAKVLAHLGADPREAHALGYAS